jgi:hypothetical protein
MLTKMVKRKETQPGGWERTVIEEVPLKVPEYWEMFTKAGNRRITKIAQKALDKLGSLLPGRSDFGYRTRVEAVLFQFLVEYDRLSFTKAYGEAGDTAVRESVGNFFEQLAESSRAFGDFSLYALWSQTYDAACLKVRDERKKKRGG